MDHVAGVTWVDGELWCGTWDGDDGERRQLDPCTGEAMQTLEMPRGAVVSGRESDGAERFFCGNARGRECVSCAARGGPRRSRSDEGA